MIQGAKGGGTPVDANDTLYSVQRAEIVDLWGEGQIGGLVNGLKSVYLDNVPVENADGTRNFKDFAYQVSLGGPTKGGASRPHAFEDVATEVAVGVTVLAGVPVVRTIADPTVDAVRITITVPALMETNENGDRNGASFEWAIDVQSAGGGYVQRHHDTVSGKASSAYSKAVKIDLKAVGPAPWDIRVRRITADSAVATLVNAFGWTSYTALSGVRMLYPNSAGIGITFDARNFGAVPVRGYDLMGISDWDVPVNYNPLARTLAGNWNGLFKQAWTNNPAWVLYNLVQNKRYGLGEYITALPDKWTLYQLAQWCDGLVPDGRGGAEPRYTINACITQQSEALQLLQDICSVFRGALLYGGGTLGASWDAPGTPVASYVPANVVDGLFTYGDTSLNAMKSSCTCWYTDRSQFGKPMPATWDDPDLVERFGMRPMEIRPFGIASPGQALRMAKWALYTTAAEGATVAFRVGAQGQVGRLGEIFQVADPSEAGERLGGRVKAATTSQVTLDAPVTLLSGEAYTLWITMPDPASPAKLKLEHRAVSNGPGVTAVLNLATPLGAAPMPQTMWLLEGSSVAPTLWRYVGLKEVRNKDNGVEFEVTGLRYEPGKFALIEANQPLTVRPTRRLADGAPTPTGLTITETNYIEGNTIRIRATVSWQYPAAGLTYEVSWRLKAGPWTTLARTSGNTVDLNGMQPGLLEVQLRSRNILGQLSVPVAGSLALTGSVTPPADVSGLAYTIVPGGLLLKWDANTDATYSNTRLSYGAAFAGSTFFWSGNGSDYTVRPPADGTYLVWAVHVDTNGNVSATPTSLSVVYTAMSAGSDGISSASVHIYKRSTTGTPALPTAACTYTFASGLLTGVTNGWTTAFPSGAGPIYASQALAAAAAPTDNIAASEWAAAVVLVQDGTAGSSAPSVDLTFSTHAFITPANSATATPSSITVAAFVNNIASPTFQWYIDSGSGFVLQGASSSAITVAAFPVGQTRIVKVVCNGAVFDVETLYSLKDGDNAIQAGLNNQHQTISCDSTGTPLSSGSGLPITAQITAVRGAAVLTSGVTYSYSGATGFSGITLNTSTGAISISGITAAAAWVDLWATVAGVTYPAGKLTANKSLNGQNGVGTTGTRGSVRRFVSGWSSWNDAAATASVPSGAPLLDDEVTLYNGTTYAETRRWNGSSWVPPGTIINGSLLVTRSVTANALIANSITAASGVIADAAVGTLMIGADAVTVPVASVDTTDYVLTTTYQQVVTASFINAVATSGENPRTLLVQASVLLQSTGTATDSEMVYLQLFRYFPSLGVEISLGIGEIPVTMRGGALQLETLPVADTTTMSAGASYIYRLKLKRSAAPGWSITSLGASLYIMGAKR